MSLRVWLPLDGTLENKGISSYTITSSGSSVVTNGKIGSCMKITSSTSLGYTPDFNINPLSFGGWFKFNLNEIKTKVDTLTYSSSATSPTGNLLGNTSYGGIGLIWVGNNHYSSGTFSSMSVFATLRTGSVNQRTSSITIEFDKWVHIMLTWDPNTHILSLYKDGTLVNSKTFSAFTNGVSRILQLDWAAIYGSNGPSASIPIYCNDVRVYDHCLSAAEIKEISQGLVLHYKLDHFTQPNLLTGNINLIAQWTADGVTKTQDENSIKVVNNNSGNHRIYNGVSNVWTTSGQKFTVSFDAKATANGHIIQASRSLGDLAPETTLTTEWKHYTVQLTNTASVTDGTLSIQSKTSSGTFWIRNVKLEKGTVESRFVLPGENDTSIKDSSGYGHNGTITGTPTLSSNTPRYSSCLQLTSGQKISGTGLLTTPNPIWTVNFWVKMYSNTYTAWADVITFKGNKTIRVEVSNSNGKNLAWYNYPLGTSDGIPISNINYDEWNMITMVWNGTSILSYFNGVLKYTATISGTAWTPNGEMTIGDTGMYMYMSDVRIYATALSADDILALYHTSAKIDNQQNFHTYELVENQSAIKITKHGQVKLNELNEAATTKFYKTNKNIDTKQIIEF